MTKHGAALVIAAIGIAAATCCGIGQVSSNPIHRTIWFCVAGFFAVQLAVFPAYSYLIHLSRSRLDSAGSSPEKTSIAQEIPVPAIAIPAATPTLPLNRAPSPPRFIYELFEISLGHLVEKHTEAGTTRIELVDVLTTKRQPDFSFSHEEKEEPCAEIRVGSGSWTCSTCAQELRTNHFRIFKHGTSRGDSIAFKLRISNNFMHFEVIMADHINIHAKTARLVFISSTHYPG